MCVRTCVCVRVYVRACECLIHLNQVQFSHFLSQAVLSSSFWGRKIIWARVKWAKNNVKISSASFPPLLYLFHPLAVSFIRANASQRIPSSFILTLILFGPLQLFIFWQIEAPYLTVLFICACGRGLPLQSIKKWRESFAGTSSSPPFPFVCKVAAVNLMEGECCDYLMVSQAAADGRIKFRICFPRR